MAFAIVIQVILSHLINVKSVMKHVKLVVELQLIIAYHVKLDNQMQELVLVELVNSFKIHIVFLAIFLVKHVILKVMMLV